MPKNDIEFRTKQTRNTEHRITENKFLKGLFIYIKMQTYKPELNKIMTTMKMHKIEFCISFNSTKSALILESLRSILYQ